MMDREDEEATPLAANRENAVKFTSVCVLILHFTVQLNLSQALNECTWK